MFFSLRGLIQSFVTTFLIAQMAVCAEGGRVAKRRPVRLTERAAALVVYKNLRDARALRAVARGSSREQGVPQDECKVVLTVRRPEKLNTRRMPLHIALSRSDDPEVLRILVGGEIECSVDISPRADAKRVEIPLESRGCM